ncbi:16S rRNA (cytidine(1402)-2'-O)-methyltransferase [Paludicola sp. MB14-C6]|uniref:16S rRNA (cytidine(1402)-2'-O)-methyltransferase n=1 Tax=Paludihabitans sp. MB14-C6 TaxID=3070656 RepID=UPI0027DC5EAF|nr:16S rRNA (cytidine(1402)-2'-O)-methyltransferase [Paludicola sp. MB14-C6]WMJ24465.1 16S rRNA (cytidine(1402)-2'-O)-methyltransferase [Paludicola sp. MB14-C6]
MSYRAINTLKEVDFIAAEDTRVTLKLLNHFDIKKPMISYYEHNLRERGEYILNRILNGETCAIVSDAGMPCISDPGEDLVRICAEQNVDIKIIPGPSAVISGLCLSGLKTSRFTFEGFLSTAKTNRMQHLNSLKQEERTMIFYEAPHKLLSTLKDMQSYFGNRKISIARELTKVYEQVMRTTLDEAVVFYSENTPKGEFVLVIEGAAPIQEEKITLEQAIEKANEMVQNGVKATDAAKQIAKQTNFKKSDIYNALLEI